MVLSEDCPRDGSDTDASRTADTEIEVTQREGFLCKVRLKTQVQFPASRTFDILTQPDNTHIFKNIKAITYRKVLEDNHRGRQRIELEHEAEWRFLIFGGRFRTRLWVFQDKPAGKLEFKLAKAGMMKAFEGRWHIYDATASNHSHKRTGSWPPVPSWLPWMHESAAGHGQACTVLELEQSVCPNVIPPPPIDRLLKGIAKKQVCNVVDDLRREINRIKKEEAEAG